MNLAAFLRHISGGRLVLLAGAATSVVFTANAAPPPRPVEFAGLTNPPTTLKTEPPRALPPVRGGNSGSGRGLDATSAESIARLEVSARQSPETAERWVRVGEALMQRSRETQEPALFLRAQSAFERATELDARDVDARVGLAWVFNTVHDFAQGRAWAEKALELDPHQARAHALLSDAAVELGDYDAGLEHCQAALDARPDLTTLSRAGHLVWMMGDARRGRMLMEKAIKAGGTAAENVAWCRAQLALMLWQEGALLPAVQQVEWARQAAPRNPLVLNAVGRIQTARGDFAAATAALRQSLEAAPSHDALALLVDVQRAAGQDAEAQATEQRLLEFHRQGLHAHAATGEAPATVHAHGPGTGDAQLAAYWADHERQPAEAVCEAELAYRTFKNVYTADTLAWCYYRAGRYEEARTVMKRARRWNTPDARLAFHAGMIEAKLGNCPAARQLLARALSQNPRFHPRDAEVAAQTLVALGEASAELSAR